MFCVLPLGLKTSLALFCLALSSCAFEAGDWQEVTLSLPDTIPDVVYRRQSMPNFVGTEQYRRVRVDGQGEVDFPVQMGGRDPVNVYLVQDSSGARLYFDEGLYGTVVELEDLTVTERSGSADTMGTFVGSLQSPKISDLRFVPASVSPPARFRP